MRFARIVAEDVCPKESLIDEMIAELKPKEVSYPAILYRGTVDYGSKWDLSLNLI